MHASVDEIGVSVALVTSHTGSLEYEHKSINIQYKLTTNIKQAGNTGPNLTIIRCEGW